MSEKRITLAVAIKSSRCGIAVFAGEHLVYYDLRGLARKRRTASQAIAEIIRELIGEYRPQRLALEELIYRQQNIRSITKIYQTVRRLAKSSGIEIAAYSPKEARKYFSGWTETENANIYSLMTERYPELRRLAGGEPGKDKRYINLLFRALLVGLFSVHQNIKAIENSKSFHTDVHPATV